MSSHQYTNSLIHETSPYLLQHAHNPVNWIPWSETAFRKAREEDKLVLVSIGYSACHWCHVMEHESFEDEEVAAIMNEHFICLKVDREERPDVDQVYMTAVQLMTQRGGWPLNCFTLPDGRPVYGGTYFPKEQWKQILLSLVHTYRKNREEVIEYAEKLSEGIQESEWIKSAEPITPFRAEKLEELVTRWAASFDHLEGGSARAPKFPLPNNYDFLLSYAVTNDRESLLNHVFLTLKKMCYGGIYDQIGGGFARYSVDMLWKVPHFEKMLYDNAQLISLYAKAYAVFGDEDFLQTVTDTIDWLNREMRDKNGLYYSAIDADSEGEEGKFYVWKKDELQEVLGADYEWAARFFNINGNGYWEEGNYILLRKEDPEFFKDGQFNTAYQEKIAKIKSVLRKERDKRVFPGIDTKVITSWNAQLATGFFDAYRYTGIAEYFTFGKQLLEKLIATRFTDKNRVFRIFTPEKQIEAFLDDYAFLIEACLSAHQVSLDKQWLETAVSLTEICIAEFQDTNSKMFYYTASSTELIARKMELNDNVIPATNSVMARNLYTLGILTDHGLYTETAAQLLSNIYEGMETYGSGYSNWAILLSKYTQRQFTLKFSTADKNQLAIAGSRYLPDVLLNINELAEHADKKEFFLCYDQLCDAPETDLETIFSRIAVLTASL